MSKIVSHGREAGSYRNYWNGKEVVCRKCGCRFQITDKTYGEIVEVCTRRGGYMFNDIECPECHFNMASIYEPGVELDHWGGDRFLVCMLGVLLVAMLILAAIEFSR
ncbi:MAG: hypothetical protein ABIF87_09885 [Pseudomonadota bacterium]